MREFRLFISSPGDAAIERRRTENVVSRLNGEFTGLAQLATVRWETEAYQAFATFQAQIPAAIDCDIVIGILRWRLGTPLPPTFPDKLPGGEPYPSGTAYEILTSVEKRHAGADLPDVYVFRYTGGPPLIALGEPEEETKRTAWATLGGFISRWFQTPTGEFEAAFNIYASEDDFERQLETLLRKWLADKVSGGRVASWPEIKRSPFRGLGVFGTKHAPVFFGRSADIRKSMDLWRSHASKGERHLLIIGASGSGKSSLARAGLIPRLTTPGVIPEVDHWRVAALRPGDSPKGPFASLAGALFQTEADLPDEEKGRGDALPEIAAGDFKTPADLDPVLAQAQASAVQVVVRALDRIAERVRLAEKFDRPVRCDLVLLVDQLDELFVPSLTPETRNAFADLLTALVASGRVWVITTLRADLYEPMLKVAALKALKDKSASYDLTPPGAAELAEIVRKPVEAAGIIFETDSKTGECLDERLLREANRPDMLPLVQLALSKLWEARVTRGSETILPIAAFEAQGGVKGIIQEAGETATAGLGDAERARLAPLIRRLAELSRVTDGGPGTLNVRAVSLAEASPDAASRRLIDALVAARLLTLGGQGNATNVRLAHQRVLTDWARAAKIVAESVDFYRVRDEVEDRRRRWELAGKRGDLLLGRGLPLAEARVMAEKYGPELLDATRSYVAASRRRANRAQAIGWGAAVVFALVAIVAGIEAKIARDRQAEATRQKLIAEQQTQIAEHNFEAAKETVRGLIVDIAEGLKNVAGMRVATIRNILETVRGTMEKLLSSSPDNPDLLLLQAQMLDNFTQIYLKAGDQKDAIVTASKTLEVIRNLAARKPDDPKKQRNVWVAMVRIGDIKLQAGDQPGGLALYEKGLEIAHKLATESPDNIASQRDLSIILVRMGVVKAQAGNPSGALVFLQQALVIDKKLADKEPANAKTQEDLGIVLDWIGNAKHRMEDRPGALAAYQQALEIRKKLADQDPGYAEALDELAGSLSKIGGLKQEAGDKAGALAAYQQALDMRKARAAQDPGNARAQGDLADSWSDVGAVKEAGDRDAALAAHQQALDIRKKLAAQDPGNARAQRDLSASLVKVGGLRFENGDKVRGVAALEQGLEISRKLAAQEPDNADAQWQLFTNLSKVALTKQTSMPLNLEAIRIGRGLYLDGKLAPSRKETIDELWIGFKHLGALYDQNGLLLQALHKTGEALAAYENSIAIYRQLAAAEPANAEAQRYVANGLEKVGDAKLEAGDKVGAIAAFEQELEVYKKLGAKSLVPDKSQRDVSIALNRVGDAKLQAGDTLGAITAFEAALDFRKKRAAQMPEDIAAQHDLWFSLDRVGDAKLHTRDTSAALIAFGQALAITKVLAAQKPDDVEAQRDLSSSFERIADAKLQAGDKPAAISTFDQALVVAKALAARRPTDTKVQNDIAHLLARVARARSEGGDVVGALSTYEERLGIRRKLAQDKTNKEAQSDLIEAIGSTAYEAMLAKEYAKALQLSDESIALAPNQLWLYTNRAHALMMLDRTTDAQDLYLKYRGKSFDGKSWEQLVEGDFVEFRKAGVTNALMDVIEKEFAKSK